MNGEAVLAIDQGTTSTKALLIDRHGVVIGSAAEKLGISSPRPQWVEQDGERIWASVVNTVATLTQRHPSTRVIGVALSNQRESVIAWDRATGAPASPVISWQDQRGEEYALLARNPELGPKVLERTGLEFSAMYSALKLRWLTDHVDAAGAVFGTLDAWLSARLTGGGEACTEAGNAGRTMLMDLATMRWDQELIDDLGIDGRRLPSIVRSDHEWGGVRGLPGVADGTPLVAILGDSHAALYGHWALEPDYGHVGKVTFGTGSSVVVPARGPHDRRPGVSTTLMWNTDDPQWAFEGNILYTGAAMDFLARLLGIDGGRGLAELASTTPDSGGVRFVPALNGLGSPWWAPTATGTVTGLTATSTAAHVARAGIESVAHQVADVVEIMMAAAADTGLHAGGGLTASDLVMQTQADLLGVPVIVSGVTDISAVGAAALGWAALGSPISPSAQTAARVVAPNPGVDDEWRSNQRTAWRDALVRAGVNLEDKDER